MGHLEKFQHAMYLRHLVWRKLFQLSNTDIHDGDDQAFGVTEWKGEMSFTVSIGCQRFRRVHTLEEVIPVQGYGEDKSFTHLLLYAYFNRL